MKRLLPLLLLFLITVTLTAQEKSFFYATMDAGNAKEMKKDFPNDIEILAVKRNVAAVYLSEDASHILHDKILTHGPGFVFKATKEKAIAGLEIEYGKPKNMRGNFTITEDAVVLQALDLVNTQNIEDHILTLEAYSTRYHTYASAEQAVLDLKTQWETMIANAGRTDISVRIYEHVNTPMPSVILTIEGAENPDEFVIIGGHIDSTSNQGNHFAPGADDNASGIATITEAFRVLLEMEFIPNKTIEIMAYAAEEIGLVGSAEIAENYNLNNVNVLAYVQFDMTNYKGSGSDVYITTDNYNSSNLNGFLIELMDYYNASGSHQFNYGYSICNYGCSDHYSWAQQGYETSFPFEASFGQHNPAIHTAGDDYSMSGDAIHATKFTKLALEFLIETAKTQTTASIADSNINTVSFYVQDGILFYQLKNNLSLESITIYDLNGKNILNKNTSEISGNISLKKLSQGIYMSVFNFKGKEKIAKKISIK